MRFNQDKLKQDISILEEFGIKPSCPFYGVKLPEDVSRHLNDEPTFERIDLSYNKHSDLCGLTEEACDVESGERRFGCNKCFSEYAKNITNVLQIQGNVSLQGFIDVHFYPWHRYHTD